MTKLLKHACRVSPCGRQIVDPNAELNSATALFLSGANTKYIGLEYKLRKNSESKGKHGPPENTMRKLRRTRTLRNNH